MAGWLIPALRAVLPHVGDIISMARPVFTKKGAGAADPGTVQQQITELQSAASQNAANVKELAEQLQRTVTALEQASTLAESRLRRTIVFCAVAVSLSVMSLAVAVIAFSLR
jgi:hypothetical protein